MTTLTHYHYDINVLVPGLYSPSASVQVNNLDGSAATLYSGASTSALKLNNPIISALDGTFQFWAAAATYLFVITTRSGLVNYASGGLPATYSNDASGNSVLVGPAATYGVGLNEFVPITNDYAGIIAAYNAAVAAGGGIVKLLPVTYNIGGNKLPFAQGVLYQGSGVSWDMANVNSLTGTVILGDGTANAFDWNSSDANPWSASSCSCSGTALTIGGTQINSTALPAGTTVQGYGVLPGTTIVSGSGTSYVVNNSQTLTTIPLNGNSPYVDAATFLGTAISGAGVTDIIVKNCLNGIKVGGLFNAGVNNLKIDRLFAINCIQWGVDIENCNNPDIGTIVAQGCTQGQYRERASGVWRTGTSYNWNYGDHSIKSLFCESSGSALGRGICFEARGLNCSLNDVHVGAIGTNGKNASYTNDTATFDGSTAPVAVNYLEHYALDTAIIFVNNGGTFTASSLGSGGGQIYCQGASSARAPAYWIVGMSGTSGAGYILIAKEKGGTPITVNAAGVPGILSEGAQLLEVGGRLDYGAGAAVTGFTVGHMDLESGGTVGTLVQYAYGTRIPFTNTEGNNALCLRHLDSTNMFYFGEANNYLDIIPGDGSYVAQMQGTIPKPVNWGTMLCGLAYNGTYIGIGIHLNPSSSTPDITRNSTNSNIQLTRLLNLTNVKISSSSHTLNLTNEQSVTLVSGGTAPVLPAAASTNLGCFFLVGNNSGGAITMNTTSSQNIVGAGASATTFSLADKTDYIFISRYDGSAYYWSVK